MDCACLTACATRNRWQLNSQRTSNLTLYSSTTTSVRDETICTSYVQLYVRSTKFGAPQSRLMSQMIQASFATWPWLDAQEYSSASNHSPTAILQMPTKK